MSKLEELIQQLCPDGVECRNLEECCNILDKKRKPVTKAAREAGEYRYYGANGIQDYVSDYIFDGTFVLVGEDGSVITKAGTPVVTWAEGKIWVNNHAHIIEEKTGVLLRYLFHYIQTIDVTSLIHGNIPKLTGGDFKTLKISIPPLEIQREIVRILDNFTELTAELTARKKQYEFYRNQMMSFNCSVPIKRIGEITNVFSAARVHKNEWISEGVPFYRSSDVISLFNGVPNSRGKAFISYELYNKLTKKSGIIKKGDVLVTGGGTIGIPFVVPTDDPIYVKDADLICIQRSDAFESKYLYHYFLTTKFKDYLSNITHNATIAHYTISQILDTPIPLPSLEEQRRIVSILDRFDALCNNLTSGLPAEIAARQKQYEYYRDKLLTFKPLA